MNPIFQRTELLLGPEALERAGRRRVIIFGVGGVGSWCAESLVRSGIVRLTIVDSDRVCTSNINRQLMATTRTVGQAKVEVLRERLLSINPEAEVTAMQKVFNETTAQDFGLEHYDYIVDAIDSLKDKALLILMACHTGARLFSSMGAALKIDPTRVRVAEFWSVQGDPLARALRKRFKKEGRYPRRKFKCVYSDEHLPNKGHGHTCDEEAPGPTGATATEDNAPWPKRAQANGTLVHITAIFGFMLAGLVMGDIYKNENS